MSDTSSLKGKKRSFSILGIFKKKTSSKAGSVAGSDVGSERSVSSTTSAETSPNRYSSGVSTPKSISSNKSFDLPRTHSISNQRPMPSYVTPPRHDVSMYQANNDCFGIGYEDEAEINQLVASGMHPDEAARVISFRRHQGSSYPSFYSTSNESFISHGQPNQPSSSQYIAHPNYYDRSAYENSASSYYPPQYQSNRYNSAPYAQPPLPNNYNPRRSSGEQYPPNHGQLGQASHYPQQQYEQYIAMNDPVLDMALRQSMIETSQPPLNEEDQLNLAIQASLNERNKELAFQDERRRKVLEDEEEALRIALEASYIDRSNNSSETPEERAAMEAALKRSMQETRNSTDSHSPIQTLEYVSGPNRKYNNSNSAPRSIPPSSSNSSVSSSFIPPPINTNTNTGNYQGNRTPTNIMPPRPPGSTSAASSPSFHNTSNRGSESKPNISEKASSGLIAAYRRP